MNRAEIDEIAWKSILDRPKRELEQQIVRKLLLLCLGRLASVHLPLADHSGAHCCGTFFPAVRYLLILQNQRVRQGTN